jgi:putative ABC transport system ATP-binding protein
VIELQGDDMPEASDTLIKLEGVKKVFYTDEVETHALSEIHLEIKKGQYISIAGPSGCGKSTLLSILGLLDSPSGGHYWLNGQPVSNLTLSERTRIRNREIGFIFQAFNLIGDLTVYENVELPLTYRGTGAAERKQKVQHALERVGDPLILMADEPTGNLDSKNGEAVMELLRDLHRNGATICMVTHDQRYANFAERTIHLFDGRVVEETQEAHA